MTAVELLVADDEVDGHGHRQSQEARLEARAAPATVSGSRLLALASTCRDVQQTRLAMEQRGFQGSLVNLAKALERRFAAATTRELRRQPVWPWLSRFPGLRGVHTARLVALIGDPRRFPGQQCSGGHTTVPDYAPGDPCPFVGRDETGCPSIMQPPRTTTGVRSLWHYCGLHAVDGRSPRKAKGQRASWSPEARTAVLQPGGIADHIVRQQVAPYATIYYATKERLSRERGADSPGAADTPTDAALSGGPEVDGLDALESSSGLRPYQIDAIARKVAAKAFVGDLLIAMKEAVE